LKKKEFTPLPPPMEKFDSSFLNVFFTGPGGTGKSFLLQYMVHILTRRYSSECIPPSVSNQKDRCECYVCNVAITASTGIAALEIGGTTLHSAAGIGIPYEVKDFNKMWNLKNKWRNLSVLVIDEISMISGELFEYLEQTICKIRANEKPFGGLQVH
jgi:ATP-dependent DNA helicase PIF1